MRISQTRCTVGKLALKSRRNSPPYSFIASSHFGSMLFSNSDRELMRFYSPFTMWLKVKPSVWVEFKARQAAKTHSEVETLIVSSVPSFPCYLQLNGLRITIIEVVSNAAVRQIDPCFSKGDRVPKPSYLAHGLLKIAALVVLPEPPAS